MDRPFLDANVLFSAAYQPRNPMLALWSLADTELLASPYVIQEAFEALTRSRPSRVLVLGNLLTAVTAVADALSGSVLPAGIQLPVKDTPVLLAALLARSTHLLTGDLHHFGPYFGQTIQGMLILKPADYLQARQGTP